MLNYKPTFEEYVDFIENILGCKLLDYQKILLRKEYESKLYYYYPGRIQGLQILLEVNKILKEQMNKESAK